MSCLPSYSAEITECKSFPPSWSPKAAFKMLNLYSENVQLVVSGQAKAECSGVGKNLTEKCAPFQQGPCEGTAVFQFLGEKIVSPAEKITTSQISIEDADSSFMVGHGKIFQLTNKKDLAKINFSFMTTSPFSNTQGNPLGLQVKKINSIILKNHSTKSESNVTSIATISKNGIIEIPTDESVRKIIGEKPSLYSLKANGECFLVKTSQVEWQLPVFDSPDNPQRSLGIIQIQASHGENAKISTISNKMNNPLEPDFEQGDWGYDFKFGLTVLEQKNDWLKVSLCPHLPPSWVRSSGIYNTFEVKDGVLKINGRIQALPDKGSHAPQFIHGNIVIQGIDGDVVQFRPESASDMPCGDENSNASKSTSKLYKAHLREFYGSDHRLKVGPAYPKGC